MPRREAGPLQNLNCDRDRDRDRTVGVALRLDIFSHKKHKTTQNFSFLIPHSLFLIGAPGASPLSVRSCSGVAGSSDQRKRC